MDVLKETLQWGSVLSKSVCFITALSNNVKSRQIY